MPRLTESEIEKALPQYEGLIYATARRIEGVVELPFDDIKSELRMKAWKALQKFDSGRSNVSQKVFVGTAIINKKKDILRDDKGQKRTVIYIEDVSAGSPSDLHYFAIGSEAVYAAVERELPLIPSTLSDLEKHVLVLLYDDFTILDIQRAVGIKRQEVKDAIERIQLKFADWAPGTIVQQHLQAA